MPTGLGVVPMSGAAVVDVAPASGLVAGCEGIGA